jgi:hypothetical protein
MSEEELGRFFPLVLHLHVVGEDESPLVERRVDQRKGWPNPDEDAVCEFLVDHLILNYPSDPGGCTRTTGIEGAA